MASDGGLFSDLDLDIPTRNEPKQDKPHLSTSLRKVYTFCRRQVSDTTKHERQRNETRGFSHLIMMLFLQAFSSYVASKRHYSNRDSNPQAVGWYCCDQTFTEPSAAHQHVARTHQDEVHHLTESTFQRLMSQLEDDTPEGGRLPGGHHEEPVDMSSWMPDTSHLTEEDLRK